MIKKLRYRTLQKNSKEHKLLEQISNLVQSDYDAPGHLKPGLDRLVKEWEEGTEHVVFVRNAKVVGVSFYKEITPYLVRTFRTVVKKELRGQGIGRTINNELERRFKNKGYKKTVCNIYTDNFPSLFLKIKRGYLIEGLLRDHDEKGMHEYILGKEL